MNNPSPARPAAGSRRFDVTLVGDTNLDILLYGLPENLPLERELLAEQIAIRVGGSSAITAHNLAALGNSVGFITTITDDDFGARCQSELRNAGIDLSQAIRVGEVPSGVTVHLQHQEARHMLTYAGATFHVSFDDLDMGYLADSRHFHMSSYYLQRALTPQIPELFSTLKRAGVTISLDPNDDPAQKWDRSIFDALRYVDVLMPNQREACLLAAEPDLDKAINVLRDLVPLLIVKRGSHGASAYQGPAEWHVSGRSTDVIDAVGAGDSFNAGFLHGWLRQWPIERALAFGNLTGAWSTTANGGTSAFQEPKSLRALQEEWREVAGWTKESTAEPLLEG